MARDIFGRVITEGLFGRKISKKQIKREILEENRRKGRAAEEDYKFRATLRGCEVERSPRGRDFIERERDLFTGRVIRTTHVEVKSSSTARLSKLQQSTKKKKRNYRVERQEPLFF